MVLAGAARGAAAECALVAALLSDRDPLRRPAGGPRTSRSDVLDRLDALSAPRSSGGARTIFQARDQILSLVERLPGAAAAKTRRALTATELGDAVRFAVLQGFSDRVARRREPGSPRAVMVGGRGVRLAPDSAVTAEELFVCVVVDGGGDRPEALVRLASGIDRADLPAARLTTRVEVAFDAARERVVAKRAELFDDLVLAENEIPAPADAAAQVLTEAALADLDRAFGLASEPSAGLLARWEFLAAAMPELALPAPRAALADLAPGLIEAAGQGFGPQGKVRRAFSDLRALDIGEILLGTLSRAQRQALDREAPERLAVPSGSAIRIAYAAGQPPVLAARIQELFGLAETPRLAAGRVPVLLHLLAPSGRPQQVTSDLASFWNGAYREVRKELAGRYPKHSWPDDPWTATAERRPRRSR
jgi:ATP-dependent helicase HrpB